MSTAASPRPGCPCPGDPLCPTRLSMLSTTPRYLLLAEGVSCYHESRWRFVLQGMDTPTALSASDCEPQADNERAELLAVVRGLEALEEPAHVTLVTRSKYVQQGLARGLHEWRENGWQWERFGRLVPVRDHDLWQRVDRAMAFHQVECRVWRFDEPAAPAAENGRRALAGPHFVLRRRPDRCSSRAACCAAVRSAPSAALERQRQNRTRSPARSRWVTGALENICTAAARVVSTPRAAS